MNTASGKALSREGHGFEAIYPGTSQKLAYTGASAQSAALQTRTSVVRLVSTSNCHVAFGSNPTAVADGTCLYLPLGVPVNVGVAPGTKIAAIQDSAGGNLFITEGA